MTPKEKYNERKRLKAERLLDQEQGYKSNQDRLDEGNARVESLLNSLERIASVMELWADKQAA